MQRSQSIFKSTKLFVETSVGLTVDTVTLVRNELAHTARLNSLENDAEFDETVMAQLDSVIEALTGLTDSKADQLKKQILEKRLAKLSALI